MLAGCLWRGGESKGQGRGGGMQPYVQAGMAAGRSAHKGKLACMEPLVSTARQTRASRT